MYPQPPRFADRLLEWVVAPHRLEALQGDLHEEFAYQVGRVGLSGARWRYWRDVLGFVRPWAVRRKPDEYSSPFLPTPVMIRNFVKIALRNLAKHRVGAFINLTGLTLGVTACLAIYLITQHELRYDTFHADGERIYRLVGTGKFAVNGEEQKFGFIPNAVPSAIRDEVPGLESVAAFHNIESAVLIPDGKNKPKRFEHRKHGVDNAEIIVAEPQYFDIFRYQWLAGNPKTALNEPYTLVLSEQKARTYFGDLPVEQFLGKEVIYWDSLRVSVAGIVRDWKQPSDLTFTDFISFATIRANPMMGRSINLDQWDDIWSASQAFVKLPKGATPAQFGPAFSRFSKKHFAKEFKFVPHLQPLRDLHFDGEYMDNYARKAHLPTLYGLMGVALFILLIAAINFINLTTAQSIGRAQEVGIRKVLGSNRTSLIAQFMSETLILTFGAILIALALTPYVLSAFASLIPKGVALNPFNGSTLLFLGLLAVVTSLLSGLYPAWALSSYRPAVTLKGQNALVGNQRGYLRKSLIVFQFTVSLVFIVGTLFVGRQLSYMRNKDLGFTTDAIVSLKTGRLGKSEVLAQKLRQLSEVEQVTREWFPPMGQSYMMTRLIYRGKRVVDMDVSAKVGDENYIPLYQLRLLAGRNYAKSDSLRELVINETYAKALGFRKPAQAINQFVEFNGKKVPIVGVVADFHEQSFHEKIGAAFIGYLPQQVGNIGIKLATKGKQLDDVKNTLASIERVWQQVYPDTKFEYSFLDESIARLYEKEQQTAQLVNTATLIAILISCLGLFGLATFTAEQRTKEIGVRKVLGASVASIVALLSVDFIKLVGIAIVLASPLAWYAANQWLQGFAYKVDLDWWVFALAGLLAVGIALLTVSFQSIRAALTNPVESLRSE